MELRSGKCHFIVCHVTKCSTILGVFWNLFPAVAKPSRHFETGVGPGDEVYLIQEASCQTEMCTLKPEWVKREKVAKVRQSTSKLRLLFSLF